MASLIFPLMIVEVLLSATWNRFYFGWGLPIFSRRIAVPENFAWQLPVSTLESKSVRRFWPVIRFCGVSDVRCGFRESYLAAFSLFKVPYAPIMRGAIILNPTSREIRVVGLCNWYIILAVFVVFGPAIVSEPKVAPLVLVLLGGSYAMQSVRFGHVAESVANVVKSG